LGYLGSLDTLRLGPNNLTGPIPPELRYLTALTILSLSNNSLSGPIPPELGYLSNLERLNLSDNQLVGPIPSELSKIPSLRSLRIWPGNDALACWRTQAALDWTSTLDFYDGPQVACRILDLPMVVFGNG
jgi:hypothetical protein